MAICNGQSEDGNDGVRMRTWVQDCRLDPQVEGGLDLELEEWELVVQLKPEM